MRRIVNWFRIQLGLRHIVERLAAVEERIEAFQAATIQRVVSLESRIDNRSPDSGGTPIADPRIINRELVRRLEEFTEDLKNGRAFP